MPKLSKAQLTEKAEALGVVVDPEWTAAQIIDAIEDAKIAELRAGVLDEPEPVGPTEPEDVRETGTPADHGLTEIEVRANFEAASSRVENGLPAQEHDEEKIARGLAAGLEYVSSGPVTEGQPEAGPAEVEITVDEQLRPRVTRRANSRLPRVLRLPHRGTIHL